MVQSGVHRELDSDPKPVSVSTLATIEAISTNVGRSITAAMWVLIVRYGYLSVAALSGKQTIADMGLKLLGNLTISKTLCMAAAGGGILYGAGQHRLRKKTIRTKAQRIKQLEETIDPARSSSTLMPDGSTRPEDLE